MARTATVDRVRIAPVPYSLLKLMAARRLRKNKPVAALVSVSIALAIAASFTVTALTETMVWNIESRVKGPGVGAAMVGRAARGALLPWHVVSLAAAVVALSAISCVLAVAFVGRKKSLGILKTLGGTTSDLARLLATECLYMGAIGVPVGVVAGLLTVSTWLGPQAVSVWCFIVALASGVITLAFGVWLPMRLVRNASCYQLLNNAPVYAFSNPSCANCGLCGGF